MTFFFGNDIIDLCRRAINFYTYCHRRFCSLSIGDIATAIDEDSDGKYASLEGASSSAIHAIFRSIEVCTYRLSVVSTLA